MERKPPLLTRCVNCQRDVRPKNDLCPECGFRLTPPSVGSGVNRVLSVVLLVVIGVPSALGGGCAVLVGAFGGAGAWQLLLAGIAGLAVFAGLVWYVNRSYRVR